MSVRNELLQQVLTAYGGAFTGRESRNELLKLIALQIDSSADLPNNRNEILETILELVGGAASDDNRNALMNAIVSTLVGVEAANRNDIIKAWVGVAGGSTIEEHFWIFNGASYAIIPNAYLDSSGFDISFDLYNPQDGDKYLGADSDSDSGLWVDCSDTSIRAFIRQNGTLAGSGSGIASVEKPASNMMSVNIKYFDGILTMTIDGVSGNSNVITSYLDDSQFISNIGRRNSDFANGSSMRNLTMTGLLTANGYTSNSAIFKLNEAFSDSHEITDSDNGVVGTKYNDVEADYSQTEPS